MFLPQISKTLTAVEAEDLALWHEEKAAAASAAEVQRRHEIIAFRLWKAAFQRRAADRIPLAA